MTHSLTQTISYVNPASFTFPAAEVNFPGTKAELKIGPLPSLPFVQGCSSPTGFTYNATYAEFAAGVVRQLNQRITDSIFGATYTSSINGSFGNGTLTGTPIGGAAVAANKLDLAHNDSRYVDYDGTLNALLIQTGCIRFKLTPNYTGSPALPRNFINISKADSDNTNMIYIRHSTGGNIEVGVYSKTAGPLVSFSAPWSPTSGVTYEIELNFDITAGATRLFINGVQFGTTNPGSGLRDSNIGLLRVGSNLAASATSNFSVEDLIIFNVVKHTANYTPGYTIPEGDYVETAVTCPELEYTGTGTLQAITNFVSTIVGSPKFTLQIGRSGTYLYWNGAAWAAADGSYAQSTDTATFLANVATIPIIGEIYGQFKIHFGDSATQSSVQEFTTTVTGQTYPTTNPKIVNNSGVLADGFFGITDTITETGSDKVKYVLNIDGVDKYWDGAAWSTSTGYAQSNTAIEMTTNAASLDISTGVTIKLGTYLHSDSGSSTPDVTSVILEYDFEHTATDPNECIVYGTVLDTAGDPVEGATVTCEVEGTFYYDEALITVKQIAVTDSQGEWDMSVVENATYGGSYKFTTEYLDIDKKRKRVDSGVVVPNSTTSKLSAII